MLGYPATAAGVELAPRKWSPVTRSVVHAGLPVGVSFIGRAWSEPTLIKLAFAYEQATRLRKPPEFLPTIPVDVR